MMLEVFVTVVAYLASKRARRNLTVLNGTSKARGNLLKSIKKEKSANNVVTPDADNDDEVRCYLF